MSEEPPFAIRLIAFIVFVLACVLSSIGLATVIAQVERRCS